MVYFAFKKIFLTVNFHKGSFGYVEHSKLTKLLQKLFIPTFFTVSKKGIKNELFLKEKYKLNFTFISNLVSWHSGLVKGLPQFPLGSLVAKLNRYSMERIHMCRAVQL